MLVDDEVGQCLQDIINEKCVLTQSQINGELKSRLPAKRLIHDRTVAPNLEGMLFRVKLVRPVLADRTNMMFCKEGKKMETGSSIMPLCATMFLSMSAVTASQWTARNHGRERQGMRAYRQVCDQRGWDVTVALAVSPVNGLMFHSAYIGGMNAPRLNDFAV